MTDKQPEALEKIAKALLVVAQLCDGTKRWTMSVPARPDSDPDLVLSDALRDAAALLRTQHAAIERKDALLREALGALDLSRHTAGLIAMA